MRMCSIIIVVMFAAGLLVGCTAHQTAQVTRPVDSTPYRLESEGRVPLPGPDAIRREVDRVDSFEDLEVVEEGIVVEDVEPVVEVPAVPEAGDSAAVIVAQGYRVQVFASALRDNAETARARAEELLNVTAYVQLVHGIYKVRVGDCPNRPQAEVLLQQCRQAGITDAWIVTSEVTIRRREP